MQQVRYCSHLLDGMIHHHIRFHQRLFFCRGGLMWLDQSAQHHLRSGEVLAETVMQFARDSPALLVLRHH